MYHTLYHLSRNSTAGNYIHNSNFEIVDLCSLLQLIFLILFWNYYSPAASDTIQCDEYGVSSDFSGDDGISDEMEDDVGSMPTFSDDEDDTKTRFTNYSMSSSVIRRNEGLTLVDEKFEQVCQHLYFLHNRPSWNMIIVLFYLQLYAEYDDDEIGALDHEEIDGRVKTDGPMMQFLLKQFEKQKIAQ